jgi:hypothetical protein
LGQAGYCWVQPPQGPAATHRALALPP